MPDYAMLKSPKQDKAAVLGYHFMDILVVSMHLTNCHFYGL